jgi:hypothetical protein
VSGRGDASDSVAVIASATSHSRPGAREGLGLAPEVTAGEPEVGA